MNPHCATDVPCDCGEAPLLPCRLDGGYSRHIRFVKRIVCSGCICRRSLSAAKSMRHPLCIIVFLCPGVVVVCPSLGVHIYCAFLMDL